MCDYPRFEETPSKRQNKDLHPDPTGPEPVSTLEVLQPQVPGAPAPPTLFFPDYLWVDELEVLTSPCIYVSASPTCAW